MTPDELKAWADRLGSELAPMELWEHLGRADDDDLERWAHVTQGLDLPDPQ